MAGAGGDPDRARQSRERSERRSACAPVRDGLRRRAIIRVGLQAVKSAQSAECNRSVLEKMIGRPRQAEVFAQRLAFIFATEQAAALQFGNDLIDEIVETAGQIREHDGKAVRAFGLKPFLHFVGDGLCGADHGKAGIAAEPLRELPHGEVFSASKLDGALPPAFRGIAFRNIVRQRLVLIEFRGIVAERDR